MIIKKINTPIILAVILIVLAVIWVFSGNKEVIIAGDTHNQAKQNKPDTPAHETPKILSKVVANEFNAQNYTPILTANGLSQPNKITAIKSAISARVAHKNFQDFAKVKKGQILLEFEPASYPALLHAAEQLVKLRTQQFEATTKLHAQGYASNIQLTQIETDLQNARANLAEQQRINQELTIAAPFDGIIFQSFVENGDLVGIGQPITQLASLNPIWVDINLPADQAAKIPQNSVAKISYDNHIFNAKLLNVSETGDEATRTMRIRFQVDNPNYLIKGQVGVNIEIALQSQMAHKIKKSIMGLNDLGVLGVKYLNDDNIVQFAPIKILSEIDDFVWVQGLPTKVKIITDGAAFVSAGAKVEISQ